MAIHELNDEQIRTWSLEQKDRWWLANVFRGHMPQLTIRSALTGMLLGGLLSLTNLYIGAKTGWTMGVGITSVILAYALFRLLASMRLADEFTVLENNAMQSIATAAGYMTSPMISSLAAYMMVTGKVIPLWQTLTWVIVLAILGVLFAFPFKRRFINDEQQPFPEGRAAGVVMDSLHHGEARSSLLKAQLLVGAGVLAALVKFLQSEPLLNWLRVQWLHIPEFLDDWVYKLLGYVPTINGLEVTKLTLRPELDLTMIGAGGLMGIQTGFSLLLGATINYAILVPLAYQWGELQPLIIQWFQNQHKPIAWHEIPDKINFRFITLWSLWAGVAMMTVASLLAFFAKPQVLLSSFTKLLQKSSASSTALRHIELPLRVSIIGIPLVGVAVVWMAQEFFGVAIWLSIVALVLVFFFSLIAINSTGLTSITPIGAMGKLTQLTFGALAPGNVQTNLATAAITGEVASHAANLLQDIKPGYMLGAKPRQQALGHILGVFAGAVVAVPVFYLVFLNLSPQDAFSGDPEVAFNQEELLQKYPMASAIVWRGVADVLTQGIEKIPVGARWTALVALILGVVLEGLRMWSRGRLPLSPVGIGLGFVIPFHTCLAMFVGSFLFWLAAKIWTRRQSLMNEVVVQNQEPICAGLIAGGALMGILVAVIETLVPK